MKKIPDMSDPLGMITYYFKVVENWITGKGGSSSPDLDKGSTQSNTLEYVGIAVVIVLLLACCFAGVGYLVF